MINNDYAFWLEYQQRVTEWERRAAMNRLAREVTGPSRGERRGARHRVASPGALRARLTSLLRRGTAPVSGGILTKS